MMFHCQGSLFRGENKGERMLSHRHNLYIAFFSGFFFWGLLFLVFYAVVTCCDKHNRNNEDNFNLMLSVGSSPSVLRMEGCTISLEFLSSIIDRRIARSVSPRQATMQILKESDVTEAVAVLALLREKGIPEVRLMFSPLTAEEFFPSLPTNEGLIYYWRLPR